MKKNLLLTIILLVVVAAISFTMRLVPHLPNFIPLGALALVCGVYIKSRWGVLIPLVVMVTSDYIVGWHTLVLFTWGCYFLMGVLGWWVRERKTAGRVIGATLAGSVLFYVVTNFAVWAFTPLYAKTAAGLVQSYYYALPFFRSTMLGDIFYVAVFFGLMEGAYAVAAWRQCHRLAAWKRV